LSESWSKLTPPKRRRAVMIMAVGFAIPTAVLVAVVLAPHARIPIAASFIGLWFIAHWSLIFLRARRDRRRRR
jgi:type IV secretory pathway TrbD component